ILHVGKEHGDLLALAFECGPGGENLLGEVFRRIGIGGTTIREAGATFSTEHGAGGILVVAARAKHRRVLPLPGGSVRSLVRPRIHAEMRQDRMVGGGAIRERGSASPSRHPSAR